MPSAFEPLTRVEIEILENVVIQKVMEKNPYYDLWERLLNSYKELKDEQK